MNELEAGLRKGAWTAEEDALLKQCVETYGEGNWFQVPARAGLNRCRKSCRLRWLNYLKPGINRGGLQEDEVDLIIRLQKLLGNKWSLIAGRLPGRTSNDIKNYWYTHIAKKSADPRNQQQEEEENQEDVAVKVKAIRPIARRPTGGKQFYMNEGGSSSQPPPPENDVNYWWDGFGGGSASEAAAAAANRMQIDSPWASGDGFTDDAGGGDPDDDDELYIDDIFQL